MISEGYYGIPTITHCCLEAHGNVAEWTGENLRTYSSTQNVSGLPGQIGQALREQGVNVPDNNIETICNYIGGGFGSKFSPDRWGIEVAQLAKAAGKPVKLMLDRNMEMEVAGARPSSFAQIKVAAKKDGTIVAWDSHSWGTGGPAGTTMPPLPYVLNIPNKITRHTSISTNTGPARAWRAPNHPQAALLTMCALDDLAAKLNMDPIEFFSKNADLAGERAEVYRQELRKAAELIDWKKNWHPRGDKTAGHHQARPGREPPHLGRSRPQQQLQCDHPPGRFRGSDPGQPGPRDRHADRHRHRGGGDAGASGGSHHGEHRRQQVPVLRRFGRQHDGGWRVGLHSARLGRCPATNFLRSSLPVWACRPTNSWRWMDTSRRRAMPRRN